MPYGKYRGRWPPKREESPEKADDPVLRNIKSLHDELADATEKQKPTLEEDPETPVAGILMGNTDPHPPTLAAEDSEPIVEEDELDLRILSDATLAAAATVESPNTPDDQIGSETKFNL